MNKNAFTISDGLLRLHAKLTALSEIFGAATENGITIGHDAAFGIHCLLSEMAEQTTRLKELYEAGAAQ
jgi:hypothetical protein